MRKWATWLSRINVFQAQKARKVLRKYVWCISNDSEEANVTEMLFGRDSWVWKEDREQSVWG